MKRTPEFTLSLIGIIIFSLILLVRAFVSFYQAEAGSDFLFMKLPYVIGYHSFHLTMCVLIWIATFKIKNDNKSWGIFIFIMGALSTLSPYFISGILFLIAGIMMLARKPTRNDD
jgi:hypothetical protein